MKCTFMSLDKEALSIAKAMQVPKVVTMEDIELSAALEATLMNPEGGLVLLHVTTNAMLEELLRIRKTWKKEPNILWSILQLSTRVEVTPPTTGLAMFPRPMQSWETVELKRIVPNPNR